MPTDYGVITAGIAAVALIYSLALFLSVRRQDPGTPKMTEIATAVRIGANAFLRREYTVIAPVAIAISILIYVFIDIPLKTGGVTSIGFLVGAALSAIAGYIGMADDGQDELQDRAGGEEWARGPRSPSHSGAGA